MDKREAAAVAREFVGADLGDGRREARLVQLAQRMARKPDSSFPKALTERGV